MLALIGVTEVRALPPSESPLAAETVTVLLRPRARESGVKNRQVSHIQGGDAIAAEMSRYRRKGLLGTMHIMAYARVM
jgi:hypothetical protein